MFINFLLVFKSLNFFIGAKNENYNLYFFRWLWLLYFCYFFLF